MAGPWPPLPTGAKVTKVGYLVAFASLTSPALLRETVNIFSQSGVSPTDFNVKSFTWLREVHQSLQKEATKRQTPVKFRTFVRSKQSDLHTSDKIRNRK
ncbi:hypothetical protein RvY_10707 [Ramazzottius varieornatus]|uniref:Uncharacterized protein n=1 Tax=Ramazzottius varieornatus TaxID=947166 RepID=A0A1D1VLG5_RAMVA|nr:hypothetical protein RvY_10707 [Ramazzottius varieornatus]